MNRIARWMIRLYPATWRARYGDEMNALLADSGADAKTVADLLTGGLRMRFSRGSFLKLALALGVAGMLIGLGASYLRKPQYVSWATLEMTPAPPTTAQDLTRQIITMVQREQQQVESRTNLAAMINDPRRDLYGDERGSKPLENAIDEMRRNILVSYSMLPKRQAAAFIIRFSYMDKVKAQQTVQALMEAFMDQNQAMQRDGQDRMHGYVLKVLDYPTLPTAAVGPKRSTFAMFGCLLGFLLAGVISVVRSGGHSSSTPMLATTE
jgi:hypothetical protein